MTSEYDIPGQLVGLIAKRTTDPIALAALDELAYYFSALHDWSHEIARGNYKRPPCAVGYVQLPKTDHWSSCFKSLAVRTRLMSQMVDSIHSLERKQREEKEALSRKCSKETGLCFCPACSSELHQK